MLEGRDQSLARCGQQQQQLLLLFAAAGLCSFFMQAAGASVNVTNSSELLAALQSQQADRIVLQNDVSMGAEFEQLNRSPLQITRWGGGLGEMQIIATGTRCLFPAVQGRLL